MLLESLPGWHSFLFCIDAAQTQIFHALGVTAGCFVITHSSWRRATAYKSNPKHKWKRWNYFMSKASLQKQGFALHKKVCWIIYDSFTFAVLNVSHVLECHDSEKNIIYTDVVLCGVRFITCAECLSGVSITEMLIKRVSWLAAYLESVTAPPSH